MWVRDKLAARAPKTSTFTLLIPARSSLLTLENYLFWNETVGEICEGYCNKKYIEERDYRRKALLEVVRTFILLKKTKKQNKKGRDKERKGIYFMIKTVRKKKITIFFFGDSSESVRVFSRWYRACPGRAFFYVGNCIFWNETVRKLQIKHAFFATGALRNCCFRLSKWSEKKITKAEKKAETFEKLVDNEKWKNIQNSTELWKMAWKLESWHRESGLKNEKKNG